MSNINPIKNNPMKNNNLLLPLTLSLLLVLSSCTEVKKYGEPKQLITKDLAVSLNSNFNNSNRVLVTSNSKEGDDANAVWYSIEELENYINYVKTQGTKKGYNVNGIRMYLGVYPETEEYGEKKGKTTIFLSPTGNKIVTEKGGILTVNTTAKEQGAGDDEADIEEINPLNFGTMGHPPKMTYPSN